MVPDPPPSLSPPAPRSPVLAASCVVIRGDRVLLVKRGRPPGEGRFSFPGGRVEWGEETPEAAEREVREETGLVVQVTSLLGVFDQIQRDGDGAVLFHAAIACYRARLLGGTLEAGDDAGEARFFHREELASLPLTDGLLSILERAFAEDGLGA